MTKVNQDFAARNASIKKYMADLGDFNKKYFNNSKTFGLKSDALQITSPPSKQIQNAPTPNKLIEIAALPKGTQNVDKIINSAIQTGSLDKGLSILQSNLDVNSTDYSNAKNALYTNLGKL
jgi:hypothetical protein